ncbi:MAG: hypothetical protein ABL951_05590 [Alphaproteobacteria bacterium]
MFDSIAAGSTLVEWCRDNNASFNYVGRWIASDTERQKRFQVARQLREEYLGETVVRNLRMFIESDLSQAFNDYGGLLRPADMPESIRRSLAGIDVSRTSDGEGGSVETVKIKMVDPLKSTELMGKYLKLFNERNDGGGQGSAGEIANARIMEGAAMMDQRLNQMRARLQQQQVINATDVTVDAAHDLI